MQGKRSVSSGASHGAPGARAAGWLGASPASAEAKVNELAGQDEGDGQDSGDPGKRLAASAGPRAQDGLLDNPRPTEAATAGAVAGLDGHDEELGQALVQQRVPGASGSAARHRGPARSAIPVSVLGGVNRSGSGIAVSAGGHTIPWRLQVGQRLGGLPILSSQRHIPAVPTDSAAGLHRGGAGAVVAKLQFLGEGSGKETCPSELRCGIGEEAGRAVVAPSAVPGEGSGTETCPSRHRTGTWQTGGAPKPSWR